MRIFQTCEKLLKIAKIFENSLKKSKNVICSNQIVDKVQSLTKFSNKN